MKPKYLLFFLLSFYILNSTFSNATVRYVSKTGTSTPPYTSWETAADSIQKCINICSFGDTVYVANGVYKEKVVMIPGLSLIGAGMDSCVIDTKEIAYSGFYSVEMLDSCVFEGFKIIVGPLTGQRIGVGIFMRDTTFSCLIENNKIGSCWAAIWATDCLIKNNIISNNISVGVVFGGSLTFIDTFKVHMEDNYIRYSNIGIYSVNSLIPQLVYIRNNIFFINNPFPQSLPIFENSLSYTYVREFNNNRANSIIDSVQYEKGIINTLQGNFTNNVFLSKFENAFYTTPAASIKNNIVVGSETGVTSSNGIDVRFNNFWKVQNKYSGFTIDNDTTNLAVDPMFVNQDSLDLHLQKFSPLIDAGNPTILDKDGSRSDIGLYGGPYGESYNYEDLPPRIPINFKAVVDSPQIKLTWNRNTESDFRYYRLYRDTIADFIISPANLAAELQDTFYIQQLPQWNKNYFYKITSVDNQANESQPSSEIFINITSIDDYPMTISDYQLYQNYPNPFNPSTKISYRLKERGYVKLYLYDIKGELVSVLVNQNQEAGFYQIEFSLSRIPHSGEQHQESGIKDLASGIYIYQLMVRSENNIPVFTDIKKMIYLK